MSKLRLTFGAALFLVLLIVGTAFGEPFAVLSYVKTNGGVNPEADSITFTAYYNSDDSKIHTEDSWNDENANTGYVSSSGSCRVNPVQMGGDQSSQSYIIWMSYSGTEGNQGGSASLSSVPGSGIGYTDPNPKTLSTSDYLATPAGFAIAAGDGEAFIKWDQVSGATGYRIYKRPAAGEGSTEIVFERAITVSSGSTTNLLLPALTNGTTYYLIMIATASGKRSGHPDEIAVTPTATGIPVITGPASGIKGQSVNITGSNFGGSTGSVYFNGVAASAITSWTDTGINATIDSSTPTGAGKVIVINSSNLEGNASFTVNDPPPPVNITTTSLPGGVVGIAYSQTLTATGGTGSYNWSIFSGSLPAGLSLNPTTGEISGTPTTPGTSNFTVQAESGGDTDTQPLSITIDAAVKNFTITYLSETQAENWISVPFNSPRVSGSPISTVGDLMDTLDDSFAPQAGDLMTLTLYDNATQAPSFAIRFYDGASWGSWDPATEALALETGKMYILTISNPGRPTFTDIWSISGDVPAPGAVTFDLSYLSETQAENWISVPNEGGITDNGDLLDSVGTAFTPQLGDIMTLTLYNNATQVPALAIRLYNGSSWDSWDPATEALAADLGNPYKITISNPGRPTFTTTWP